VSAEPAIAWDRVDDARAAFRACLDALSRPGTRVRGLPMPGLAADPGRDAGAGILLALLDRGVALACDGDAETARIAATVRGLTGACETGVEDADFVLAGPGGDPALAARARRGSALAPDRGATLVYAGSGGRGCEARLSGPGVEGTPAAALPLGAEEVESLRLANASPPLGVDVLAVAPDGSLVGIPRSVIGT